MSRQVGANRAQRCCPNEDLNACRYVGAVVYTPTGDTTLRNPFQSAPDRHDELTLCPATCSLTDRHRRGTEAYCDKWGVVARRARSRAPAVETPGSGRIRTASHRAGRDRAVLLTRRPRVGCLARAQARLARDRPRFTGLARPRSDIVSRRGCTRARIQGEGGNSPPGLRVQGLPKGGPESRLGGGTPQTVTQEH